MDSESFLDQCVTRDSSIVAREIAGELILVPVRRTASEVQSIYTTNEAGRYIWELIDGERTVRDILDAILEEFEVSREEAEADLVAFLRQAEQVGAIKAC
jgi:hypothetical protein